MALRRSVSALAELLRSAGWTPQGRERRRCSRWSFVFVWVCVCACAVETREWVEELTDHAELLAASRSNHSKLLLVQRAVADAFEAQDFEAMRQHTIRLSFLTNIQDEIYKRMPVT